MDQDYPCPYLHREPPSWVQARQEPDGTWVAEMPGTVGVLFEKAALLDGVDLDTWMNRLHRRFLIHLSGEPPPKAG